MEFRLSARGSRSVAWLSHLIIFTLSVVALCQVGAVTTNADDQLRVATFAVDASPAIGSPLAYDPTKEVTVPLSCRGIVLVGADKPIVLCAVDWLSIGNDANEEFRKRLAKAAGTSPDHVTVHTLHQHDAPRCDLGSAKLLAAVGHVKEHYDVPFIERVISDAARAIEKSVAEARPIDAIAFGMGEVKEVASNRRMLDDKGKVFTTRYTACKDEAIRKLPVGVIDPQLRMITFLNGDKPVASLSFYATHPQSYYRTGGANPDFPGYARNDYEKESGTFLVHFNGAGGNVGAGKYNDGSMPMRQVLADRVRDGMKKAAAASQKSSVKGHDVRWKHVEVVLPLASHMDEAKLKAQIEDPATPEAQRVHAADKLSYLNRVKNGNKIQISCLEIGKNSIVFMPGELFVEYQLAATHMRPDRNVIMAAYGDYGPFYIGTKVAYPQGGYETSPGASNVAPEVESVLLKAMSDVLEAKDTQVHASDFTETVKS